MIIHKKFIGHFLTAFDGADYNRYYNALSEKAKKAYDGSGSQFYIDENNDGVIYEFHNNVDEQNFVCTYKNIDELNTQLELEFDEIDDNTLILNAK